MLCYVANIVNIHILDKSLTAILLYCCVPTIYLDEYRFDLFIKLSLTFKLLQGIGSIDAKYCGHDRLVDGFVVWSAFCKSVDRTTVMAAVCMLY